MPTASDRLRKQAKKVSKEIHKMNGAVKDAAEDKLRKVRKNGSKRYEEGEAKCTIRAPSGANHPGQTASDLP